MDDTNFNHKDAEQEQISLNDKVGRALELLPEYHKNILIMSAVQCKTEQEIAEILKKDIKTVRSDLAKAHKYFYSLVYR